MILLQLLIRDLLFSQSVCNRWQATVKNPLNVQKALFLGGNPGSLVVGHLDSAMKNPLLHDWFYGWKIRGTNDHGDPIIRFRVDDTLLPPSSQETLQPPCEDLKFFFASGVREWDNDSDDEDDANEEV
ncbi:hypothetical protein MMC07_005005 [Pseudocyphellaria aurata]|nr:hypothetical protein [Pseudocyphellaria aurata]